jgi:tryptophan synthase alpha chain
MSYYNPVHHYGVERLARDARSAGVDGFIVPDLPSGEAGGLVSAAQSEALHVTPMVAPTTGDERLDAVGRMAGGFVYCVSLLGTTGGRATVSDRLPEFMARVRAHVSLPLAIGFGIARPEHVSAVRPHGDAVAVGSAIVDLLNRTAAEEQASALRAYVASLRTACDEPVRDATVTPA